MNTVKFSIYKDGRFFRQPPYFADIVSTECPPFSFPLEKRDEKMSSFAGSIFHLQCVEPRELIFAVKDNTVL